MTRKQAAVGWVMVALTTVGMAAPGVAANDSGVDVVERYAFFLGGCSDHSDCQSDVAYCDISCEQYDAEEDAQACQADPACEMAAWGTPARCSPDFEGLGACFDQETEESCQGVDGCTWGSEAYCAHACESIADRAQCESKAGCVFDEEGCHARCGDIDDKGLCEQTEGCVYDADLDFCHDSCSVDGVYDNEAACAALTGDCSWTGYAGCRANNYCPGLDSDSCVQTEGCEYDTEQDYCGFSCASQDDANGCNAILQCAWQESESIPYCRMSSVDPDEKPFSCEVAPGEGEPCALGYVCGDGLDCSEANICR